MRFVVRIAQGCLWLIQFSAVAFLWCGGEVLLLGVLAKRGGKWKWVRIRSQWNSMVE
jgi:hypothetical protein